MAVGVSQLVLARLFWEGEDAPVLEAADGAAVVEDDGAGCADDSGED